ncbi:MAG: hypothetical protein CMF25_05720 [Kangiellaceae bacterium]|nr:hypothetical protein [Kangiellaceae bacterium]
MLQLITTSQKAMALFASNCSKNEKAPLDFAAIIYHLHIALNALRVARLEYNCLVHKNTPSFHEHIGVSMGSTYLQATPDIMTKLKL